MGGSELLTRQRQALRAFRQTVTETVRQEKGATKRVEAAAVKARDDAQTRTSQAQGWLEEARGDLSAGREVLERVNLTHLLREVTVPDLEAGVDAGIELEYTYSFHSKQAQYECVRSKN